MASHILALGHNHDSAPVEIREKFSFDPARIGDALDGVSHSPSVHESVILSTCNRNEIYTVVDDPDRAAHDITDFFHDFHGIQRGLVTHSLYSYRQNQAVEHLFTVASGVDSMVVGETGISSQLKKAYDDARSRHCTGPILNRLFTSSFETGKKVRTRTHLSEGSVSVSSCAVDLAEKIFTSLADKSAVLVGAGETSEQTARILRDHGVRRFIVANRTVERAAALADRLSGSGVSLDQLHTVLLDADIVITSTASPDVLLSVSDIRDVMKRRRSRPLFFIDLSVPRDIDAAARAVENIFLFDVDDLASIADENRERRSGEVIRAREIIRHEVDTFMGWYRSLGVTPTVVSLRRHFEQVRARELEHFRHKIPESIHPQMEALSHAIINKLLHDPTVELKRSADRGEDAYVAEALRRLFELKNDDDE